MIRLIKLCQAVALAVILLISTTSSGHVYRVCILYILKKFGFFTLNIFLFFFCLLLNLRMNLSQFHKIKLHRKFIFILLKRLLNLIWCYQMSQLFSKKKQIMWKSHLLNCRLLNFILYCSSNNCDEYGKNDW